MDAGHHEKPENGKGLSPSEYEIVGLDPVGQAGNSDVNGEERRGHGRDEKAEETHHACRDRGDRGWATHDGVHPAEQKTPPWTKTVAEIGVLTAGFGNSSAEFGEGERAENREDRADNPREKNDG